VGIFGALLLLAGIALVADVVVTLAWQEPVSALKAHGRQAAVTHELARLEQAPPDAATVRALRGLRAPTARMAYLGRRLAARTEHGHALGQIRIPAIGVKFTFVQGTDKDSLTRGPGHYPRTVMPGEHGTVAIAGHRTTYLQPFRHLDRVRRGDHVVLRMPYGTFTYSVTGKRVVLPSAVGVVRRVHQDRLVLTACTPLFSASHRLVVFARLLGAVPRGAAL
jgi:sortase A